MGTDVICDECCDILDPSLHPEDWVENNRDFCYGVCCVCGEKKTRIITTHVVAGLTAGVVKYKSKPTPKDIEDEFSDKVTSFLVDGYNIDTDEDAHILCPSCGSVTDYYYPDRDGDVWCQKDGYGNVCRSSVAQEIQREIGGDSSSVCPGCGVDTEDITTRDGQCENCGACCCDDCLSAGWITHEFVC